MSLSFGAPDGVAGTSSSSSSIGTIGGLVASGEGPCVPAKGPGRSELEAPGENRLSDPEPNVKLPLPVGDVAGGLVAEGVGSGGAPWLNSAQRGHLRLVSAGEEWEEERRRRVSSERLGWIEGEALA